MNDIAALQEFLDKFDSKSSHCYEEFPAAVDRTIEELSEILLRKCDRKAENILRKLLNSPYVEAQFLALYALLKAKAKGIILEQETLRTVEQFMQDKNPSNVSACRVAEKRLKADAKAEAVI